jgi:hypothetical protein
MDYVYRSLNDLQALGEQVRDMAVRVTMNHGDQYRSAQVQIAAYQAQSADVGVPRIDNYTPPSNASSDAGDIRRFATAEFANIPSMFTACTKSRTSSGGTGLPLP